MQIKVEANDMYDVLTGHGIDITEAKAIILDLLLRAEGTVLGNTSEISTTKAESEIEQDSLDVSDVEFSHDDDDFVKEDAAVGKKVSAEEPRTKSKLRRKRLNFGAFGGAADSLT